MLIDIYSTFLPSHPIESHEFDGDSVADFLDSKGIQWRDADPQPVAIKIGDRDLPPELWTHPVKSGEKVCIYIIPRGGVFNSIGSLIGKIFNVAFGWLMPSTSNRGYRSPEQSRSLEAVEGKANEAKLGSVVPELAGRHRRFVDYLTPPRRYFEDLRTQKVEFLACVGPGHYDIFPEDVKIGDTPFSTLEDNAQYAIYPPGWDLWGDPAALHWHTTEEVGGTSSGTPGLVLSTDIANRENSDPSSYQFDGDDIQRSGGEWPAAWGTGTVIRVEFPAPYDVVTVTVPPTENAPGYQISEVTGWFHHLPDSMLVPGAVVRIGPLWTQDEYRIRSIDTTATAGIYTIRFETSNSAANPVVLPPGPDQTFMFGSTVDRTIYSPVDSGTVQVSPGRFPAWTDVPARIRYEGGDAYGEWTPEFVCVPGMEYTSAIEFDLFFPNGLGYLTDGADIASETVSVQFQIRNLDTNGVSTLTYSYTQSTNDQIGFTERISLDWPMRLACRVRRITANSTSTQRLDTCHWYGLKAQIPIRSIYPNWTTMTVSLRSGGRIAAQSENKINVVATRRLPQLDANGEWTGNEATRDISAFFRYILSTIGNGDDQIDMDELKRLHAIWWDRGDTFDYVFDATTVKEALRKVTAAGMAEFTISDGKVKPVREGVRTTFEQAYSPKNMTSPLKREFKTRQPDDFDGVEVEYIDEASWTRQVVRCGLPGDQFFKVDKIRADGVLSKTRAWRIGMRRRRAMRYRRWSYSFSTELDALNSEYKSYVPLFDDIPGYGQSSLIVDVRPAPGGGALITLADAMDWSEGEDYLFGYRKQDGVFGGVFPASRGSNDHQVIVDLPTPWPVPSLKAELPNAFLGVAERFCFPAWVTDIKPRGSESVTVSAENYDERQYASDDDFPT